MFRLFSLSALLLAVSGDPRSPKIYNVLISTKKNLSPSHALPVYEPVLRTTSLGIALPPLFYQSPYVTFGSNLIPPETQPLNPKREGAENQDLPVQQFVPYGGYFGAAMAGGDAPPQDATEDPKNVIANLKRNPNIPDVPPPALPVRTGA